MPADPTNAFRVINRATPRAVALETTLLAHGVPEGQGELLAAELDAIVRGTGADPCCVGVHAGRAVVGLTEAELGDLLAVGTELPKLNTANLGLALRPGVSGHGATTVSTTMELSAAAGVRVFATGGLGGFHRGWAHALDISSDLAALARFPVAVVCSGVKSILDVVATRESLETLGVPVVGFRCDRFPAFYMRKSDARLDCRFDDEAELAAYLDAELDRTGRGVVVCNPVPEQDELDAAVFAAWLTQAEAAAASATGRDATPAVLAALHRISGGRTLRTNLALVRSNAALAGRLAVAMAARHGAKERDA